MHITKKAPGDVENVRRSCYNILCIWFFSKEVPLMDSTLERSIRRAGRSGKLPHSVIFSGSGDLTAAARFYAAALECTQQDRPCLRCPACSKVLRGIHPDVITAGNDDGKDLSVEALRALRSDAFIQPNEGACKVFLFPDCRRLTVQDQNVLLKLVEEGPGYAAFLFCAENPGVLLPTVRSRCVELAVRPMGEENIPLLPQARTLLEAMAGGERQDMIRALVGLETGKITREALQQVLLQARAGAQQALRLRYGAPAEEPYAAAAGPLSRRLGEKQLMELCEMLGRFAQECEWNVAVGQVLGAIAAEWEETL